MTPFLTGLIIGLFVGAFIGAIGIALAACGGRADQEAETMIREEHNAQNIAPHA